MDHREKREFQKNIYFCITDYMKAFDCVNHNKLWKILQEMGIPHHLTCLLRNLYVGQEATVSTLHGTTDWFKIGKGAWQGYLLSSCLLNLYAEYIIQNAGLDESQAEINIARRNANNVRYADDTTLSNGRKWGTKEPLDEGERGEWKNWLKTQHSKYKDHGIRSHHFMVNRRGKGRSSDRFYFLGLQNHWGWWLQSWN